MGEMIVDRVPQTKIKECAEPNERSASSGMLWSRLRGGRGDRAVPKLLASCTVCTGSGTHGLLRQRSHTCLLTGKSHRIAF